MKHFIEADNFHIIGFAERAIRPRISCKYRTMYFTHKNYNFSEAAGDLFDALPLDMLHLHEPRQNCTARAQIIVDWLNAHQLIAGRIWAFPAAGQTQFPAPLKNTFGQALGFPVPRKNEVGDPAPLAWECHVAATVRTDQGLVVLDPAVYTVPVDVIIWKNLFSRHEAEIKELKYYEAPLYGAFGSSYRPALQEDNTVDDHLCALQEFFALNQLMADPDYRAPDFVRFQAPPASGKLLRKNTLG